MKPNSKPPQIVRLSQIIYYLLLGCLGLGLFRLILIMGTVRELMLRDHPELGMDVKSQIIGCAALGLRLVVYGYLAKFFHRLWRGHRFDELTVRNLRLAGLWMIAIGLVVIANRLPSVAENWRHFLSINLDAVMEGAALICGAWLLKEAQQMQEEQDLTV